jgi:murein DD-endopeptidase MepM/ murein hydrolase activator NlpD
MEERNNRQTRIKNYAAAITITFLLAALVTSRFLVSYGDVESEKESLQQLENQRSDVEQILEDLQAQKSDSEAYLAELDAKMSEIAEKIYNLQQQIDTKNQEIAATQELITKTEGEISEQYASMKLRIQYMYENGNASYVAMILDSSSIGDFLNRAEYISELTSYDRQMLDELQAKKNENEAAKASLDAQLSELQVLQDNAEVEKNATETLLAAKNEEIAAINSSITDAQNQIQDLEDDIEAQQDLIAEMESIEERRKQEEASRQAAEEESRRLAAEEASRQAATADKSNKSDNNGENSTTEEATTAKNNTTGTVTSSGKYRWPLADYTYISSYFSMRDDPFGGSSTEFHNGVDIPAPTGTAVMAVAGGQVAWSYLSSSAGNWIGIDHGNGTYSVYMHMSSRLVSEGDYVSAGQTIGLVGSTGRSTAPHLHLSIRLDGSYVNPLNYVSP